MNDGKLDALRDDPVLAPLPDLSLLAVARLVELVDVVAGQVVSPADAPGQWGYYCSSGLLHVLCGGVVSPQAQAPVLFLPEDLVGRAVVAAAPSRVVVLPVRALDALLVLAPALREVPRYLAAARVRQVQR